MAYHDGRDALPETYWHEVYANSGLLEDVPLAIVTRYRIAFDNAYDQHPEIWEFFQARIARAYQDGDETRQRAYAEGTLTGIRDLKYLLTLRNRTDAR